MFPAGTRATGSTGEFPWGSCFLGEKGLSTVPMKGPQKVIAILGRQLLNYSGNQEGTEVEDE